MIQVFLGPMGAGKSTLLLQDYYNITSKGFEVKLLTGSESGIIRSRLGPEKEAKIVRDGLLENGYAGSYDLLVDECQFIAPDVVKQICYGGSEANLRPRDRSVRAYGLLSDFSGKVFDGTQAWITYADEVHFLHGVVRCHCGRAATMNARVVGGEMVKHGDTIVEGDFTGDEVYYVPLCRFDWAQGRVK
jgi:thymidine kinase